MLEVQNHPDSQARQPKIIQHQSAFVISDSIDHFCIHDNSLKSDQVGNEQANVLAFVEDIKCRLLAKRNSAQTKLHRQSVFVRLLDYSMAERIQNLDGRPDNLKDFFFEQQPVLIRVHSC